jgi:protein phosphatase
MLSELLSVAANWNGDPRSTQILSRRTLKVASTLMATPVPADCGECAANRLDRFHLSMGYASDVGRRSANEDCGYGNATHGIFLVADGVGGHPGGVEASQILVDTIPPLLVHAVQNCRMPEDDLPQAIREAICSSEGSMRLMASRDPRLQRMGSTVALGVIVGPRLFIAHLGDSRVYLVREGAMTQLTTDHTLVQALCDAGCITTEEAKNHKWRHVITELVSARSASCVNVDSHQLLPGDRLLFATDGLTDSVDEDLLGWTVTRFDNPQAAADELVRQALENEATDNITCLIVHVK